MPKTRRLSDAALVRRSQQGDRRAFALLVGRYDWRLRGLAHALLLEPEAMDAALSTAYVRAWRDVVRINAKDDLGAWLYRVTYNACIDHLRRIEAAGRGGSGPAAGIASGLASLSAADRVAVVLVDREGFSPASAARILGVAPAELDAQLASARERLAPHVPTPVTPPDRPVPAPPAAEEPDVSPGSEPVGPAEEPGVSPGSEPVGPAEEPSAGPQAAPPEDAGHDGAATGDDDAGRGPAHLKRDGNGSAGSAEVTEAVEGSDVGEPDPVDSPPAEGGSSPAHQDSATTTPADPAGPTATASTRPTPASAPGSSTADPAAPGEVDGTSDGNGGQPPESTNGDDRNGTSPGGDDGRGRGRRARRRARYAASRRSGDSSDSASGDAT